MVFLPLVRRRCRCHSTRTAWASYENGSLRLPPGPCWGRKLGTYRAPEEQTARNERDQHAKQLVVHWLCSRHEHEGRPTLQFPSYTCCCGWQGGINSSWRCQRLRGSSCTGYS